jgi:NAD(P)-dependent dehydrogenase (short-subunit alcohol dehydrogenase family)
MGDRFAGKVVLVTGAAGGIGLSVVEKFRAEGARVAVADRDVSTVEADAHLPGDLLDAAYADGLPAAVVAILGRLDIVVNNAGVIARGPVTETSDADWDLSVGVNVQAPFRISRAAIPIMAAAGGGAIVNTASCWGLRPGPGSKAGLHGLTRAIAIDHGVDGVRCNAVAPGWIDTDLNVAFVESTPDPAAFKEDIGKIHPIGRTGKPEEVGALVAWLASDDASFVTGQVWTIDGGRMAKLSLPQ